MTDAVAGRDGQASPRRHGPVRVNHQPAEHPLEGRPAHPDSALRRPKQERDLSPSTGQLFGLGGWAFQLMFHFLAALAVLVLDLALIGILSFEPWAAFSVALVAARKPVTRRSRFIPARRSAECRMFAAPACDRSYSGIAAQCVIISISERLGCLCEHRGGDHPTRSRQGKEECHVAMLS